MFCVERVSAHVWGESGCNWLLWLWDWPADRRGTCLLVPSSCALLLHPVLKPCLISSKFGLSLLWATTECAKQRTIGEMICFWKVINLVMSVSLWQYLLQISVERKKILSDDKYVMRAGFVSFNSRWGAAVCAQTQQSKDATKWLTEWAPEPRDVYWNNLSIRYVELNSRRIVVAVIVFLLVFFFLIPVTFVQSLANLDSLNQMFPFLHSLTNQ